MLNLDKETRKRLWQQVVDSIESYLEQVDSYPAARRFEPSEIRGGLARFDFRSPVPPQEALSYVVDELTRHQVHTSHPGYYGLFNPQPATMGIYADALVAAFNPQLAAWSHSPFAVELERHLIARLSGLFGYDPSLGDGTFTAGGAEANATALATALNHHFPQLRLKGLRSLASQPVFYVSGEAHHSLTKAAICAGLGMNAVREIPVDSSLKMDVDSLVANIRQDRSSGLAPFMIVATAGSTNSGTIDPLPQIAGIAAGHHMWLHVDAAWGGACALVPELRGLVAGIEQADSITFDCHKWMSVPMGAGMFLTRHGDVLDRTFRVSASYMPGADRDSHLTDPYAHSLQWSRRFIGLKVFLSLAVAGWDGYAEAIGYQMKMGETLRQALTADGWEVVNSTPLPLACFVDGRSPEGRQVDYLEEICRQVIDSGAAWISVTRPNGATPVLRACITNFRTGPEHIQVLMDALARARARAAKVGV